jgi:hypothetical protein
VVEELLVAVRTTNIATFILLKPFIKKICSVPIPLSDAPYQVSLLYRGSHTCGGEVSSKFNLKVEESQVVSTNNPLLRI